MRTIKVSMLFPDGVAITGATFREAEDALRAAQWSSYPSRRSFRREMRARARVWAGAKVTFVPCRTSKGFLLSLNRAGLCRIDKSVDGRLV